VAQEYIDITKAEPVTKSQLRGHLFKILYPFIMKVPELQAHLANCDIPGMQEVVVKLREAYNAMSERPSTVSWYARHQANKGPEAGEVFVPKAVKEDEPKDKECRGCKQTLERAAFSVRGWKHVKGRCFACSNPGGITGDFKCPVCAFEAPVFEAMWTHLGSTRHFFPVCCSSPPDDGGKNAEAELVCLAENCADKNHHGLKKFCRHVSKHHKDWVERLCSAAAKVLSLLHYPPPPPPTHSARTPSSIVFASTLLFVNFGFAVDFIAL
jgi:hypothetical protein